MLLPASLGILTRSFEPPLSRMSLLNRLVVATLPFVPKPIVGAVARRYIAGVTLEEAVVQIRSLNSRGFVATTDLLGEYITRLEEAGANEKLIESIFQTIGRHRLLSTASVKLSQLGLLLDTEACYRNVRSIVVLAESLGNRLTIDMEDSSTVDATWDIYYRLRSEGLTNVGMVSQAYLRRAEPDIRTMISRGGGEIRLCKGIYVEPESIAFKSREDVRNNFSRLLDVMFDGGCRVGIATHDDVLVDKAYGSIARHGLKPNEYEFQMLLGVQEGLRNTILSAGHSLRVYVPFGEHWYAYSVRRLRENPQIAGYVFKAMFSRPA